MDQRRFDVETVSEANVREHWMARSRRKKSQQKQVRVLWIQWRPTVDLPARITFTRHAARTLDSDNLAGAFKHVRDQVAFHVGVDDGDPRIDWRYSQVKEKTRGNYFTVTIEAGK
jgi:hypothetical protein